MARYLVPVTYTAYDTIEVEADTPMAARDVANQVVRDNSDYRPDNVNAEEYSLGWPPYVKAPCEHCGHHDGDDTPHEEWCREFTGPTFYDALR